MNPTIEQEILSLIEARAEAQPTAMEFELAYQARVTCDRIRFAIRHIESHGASPYLRDACLELLDALDRLESAERRFQTRSRRLRLHVSRNGSSASTDGHTA